MMSSRLAMRWFVTATSFYIACLVTSSQFVTASQAGPVHGGAISSQLRRASSETCGLDIGRAVQGLRISPVPISAATRDRDRLLKIGLGSYIVNGPGFCATCHTWVRNGSAGRGPWLPGGDPFAGEPKNINTAEFMSGGRPFAGDQGVFTSRNLTPDPGTGLPGRPGMSEDEFVRVMKTGRDRRDGGMLLMQWPDYVTMTDGDLRAIYAYLTAIPSVAKAIPDSPYFSDTASLTASQPQTAGIGILVDWLINKRTELPGRDLCADDVERAVRGLLASPVHIDVENRSFTDTLTLGLGSYYVNGVASCASCHTWKGVGTPRLQVEGSAGLLFGPPAWMNVTEFMAGGQPFAGAAARNLTPDRANGWPGRPGLTESEFLHILKTGFDRRDRGVLTAMQWPSYQEMTTDDLRAVYAYLRRIPSVAKEIPD